MTGRSLPEVMIGTGKTFFFFFWKSLEKTMKMPKPKKSLSMNITSCLMEPWDGPASIPFTDETTLVLLLDRKRFIPSRYSVN